MTHFELLSQSPLSVDCTEHDLAALAAVAQTRAFAASQALFSHGDAADELMVIATGTVRLEMPLSILGASRLVPFELKQPPDVVGWSALVPPYRFTLSGRAAGAVSVLAFPRTDLVSLFDSNARLGYRIMRNLASITGARLHHTQEMWVREVQRSLDERYR